MILVIDTSTSELLVAVATDEGNVLRESRHTAHQGERGIHDARLALETSKLLADLNVHPTEINRIGVVIGPGSFTGLRIGLAFAKGFAFAAAASIVTLTQHEALAFETRAEFDHIVTPGYRPGLFYSARAATPRDIELITDLSTLPGSLLVHASMGDSVSGRGSFAEITSQALAQLTARSVSAYSDNEIDALEPLYVTDFTPGN